MVEKKFEGIFPVLSLPFKDNNLDIDYGSLESLINFCIDKKAHGVVMFGVASEFYKVNDEESREIIRQVVKTASGRVPVLIGVGQLSTIATVQLAKFCEDTGVDGIIVFPPYLMPTGRQELFKHFIEVAGSVDLPVVIQDAPQISGVNMDNDFFIGLSEKCSNIKYAKIEAPFAGPKISSILAATKGKFKILDGAGGNFFYETLERGVCGLLPGCSIIEKFVEIYEEFVKGNKQKAEDIYRNILPLLNLQSQMAELFIACEKMMLKYRGVIKGSTSRDPWVTIDPLIKDLVIKNMNRILGS
ncbi:dihydrodipicolinate synthase family protein [Actinomycetota bacterium]